MDGPTVSGRGFTGPVCSLLDKVERMEYNPNFKALSSGESLIDIPEDILSKMSTDQKTSYRLVSAVKSGSLPESLQYIKCGALSHARWLTTGQRLIFLHTRHHGLDKREKKVLDTLAKFFANFYIKLYFDIKVNHLLVQAPRHILTSLRLLKAEPKEVVSIITPYIQSEAWNSHPENVLLSLLASEESQEREFAVDKILEARGEEEYGDRSVRVRTTPKLNFSAESLTDLIFWDQIKVEEPIFTSYLSRTQISDLSYHPLFVPLFSSHTQSTERCVKLTTEAETSISKQE